MVSLLMLSSTWSSQVVDEDALGNTDAFKQLAQINCFFATPDYDQPTIDKSLDMPDALNNCPMTWRQAAWRQSQLWLLTASLLQA